MRTLWSRLAEWFTREGIDLDALDFARYPHSH